MDTADRPRHRKLVKHCHEPGDFHELTFSCYKRKPLLTHDDWRRRLSRHIDTACQQYSFELVAFVYMPNHLHLLVYPVNSDPDMGSFLSTLKRPFSSEVKELLMKNESKLVEQLTVRERPGKMAFRFWQEGAGYDRNIFSTEVLQASIDYIHNNPVRRGLVDRCVDWKWSSARYYLLQPPKQQFPKLPHVHGVPPGAFDRNV